MFFLKYIFHLNIYSIMLRIFHEQEMCVKCLVNKYKISKINTIMCYYYILNVNLDYTIENLKTDSCKPTLCEDTLTKLPTRKVMGTSSNLNTVSKIIC